MKTEWICSWQCFPGYEKHFETYPTLDAARQAMAKVLADKVDLQKYIQALRKEKGKDCGNTADFIEDFLADLTMPSELPDTYDIPDHCQFYFDSYDGFRWEYRRGEWPCLSANYVYEGEENEPYVIAFDYGNRNPESNDCDRVNAVEIRIAERIDYGTSAYPLMVWKILREEPLTQEQIARRIRGIWENDIERKSVGRHLQLLQDMGFPVQHGPDGYYHGGEFAEPKSCENLSRSAYPLLILRVLDGTPKTQIAIIKEVQEKYGTKMGRKAVAGHLELLDALGYKIQKCNSGYYISE